MANSKQAIKRARQNSDRYKLRHAQRSVVRTAVKAVRADINSKDKAKASAVSYTHLTLPTNREV